jgi:FdhD protein
MENRRPIKVLHIDSIGSWVRTEGTACEFSLRIILNGEPLITIQCSPGDLEALAAGFLVSEGIIRTKEEIAELALDAGAGVVRISTAGTNAARGKLLTERSLTTNCGRGVSFSNADDREIRKRIFSDLHVTQDDLLSTYRRFQKNSVLHRETTAAHSAALCDPGKIVVYVEDIGRHNTVDKVIGRCLLEEISPADRILVISGRISSEIILKAAAAGIPVLVSKSAPTDRGVDLARKLGITLIGFVYKEGMNIYAGAERVDVRRLIS